MAMSGFICHDDYLQKTAKLTDEEVGRLFRALMRYHATGIAEDVDGRESIAFDFIREDIDRTEEAYKAKCEKNRNNRLAALNNERQQSPTNVNVPVQKEKEKEKNKENNNKDIVRRFTPPTPAEVAEYCKERNNTIDATYFCDYYAARNWCLSNGKKVADWRACVRTWEKRDTKTGYKRPAPANPAQNYSQRSYATNKTETEIANEAMARLQARLQETG